MRRHVLPLFMLLLSLALAPLAARAAPYPSMPIKLVVPYAAGGAIDLVTRPLAEKLASILGQPVIVENRAGASGNIGFDTVLRAEPNGYTFLVGSSFVISNPILQPELKWKWDSLTPVALIGTAPNVLAVAQGSPFSSMTELVSYAKANPGKLTVANPGIGSSNHLGIELFLNAAGVDMLVVPYNGTAPTIVAGISGEVSLIMPGVSVAQSNVKAGKLKALAIGSTQRSPQMPDVPTLAEAGFPDASYEAWMGLMAPRGVPREVVERMNAAVNQALRDADLLRSYANMGVIPAGGTADQFRHRLETESSVIARLIAGRHIKISQ